MIHAVLLALALAGPGPGRAPGAAARTDSLPVLRARSERIDVRDGRRWLPGGWVADPALPLDTYLAEPASRPRRITFYSDLDSLTFEAEPGSQHDFTIRLADGRECRTRLSCLRTTGQATAGAAPGPVELPLAFTRNDKTYTLMSINGSRPLRMMFDAGAGITVVYPSAQRAGAKLVWDGNSENHGTGGATTRRTSSDNRITAAGLRWDHVPVLAVERQAEPFDGIVGPDLFAERVLELDFQRGRFVVHDSLPAAAHGFARLPLRYDGLIPSLPMVLGHSGRTDSLWVVFDTGANGAAALSHATAVRLGLPGGLPVLRRARIGGVGAARMSGDIVSMPSLGLAGVHLKDVPVFVEHAAAVHRMGDLLGMDVLRRFHLYIDFDHDELYLQALPTAHEPFSRRGMSPMLWGLTGAAALLVLFVLLRRSRLHR